MRIKCPRVVPPCAYIVEQPTRYEAFSALAKHLEDVHGVGPMVAMSLALTAPLG